MQLFNGKESVSVDELTEIDNLTKMEEELKRNHTDTEIDATEPS